MKKTAGKSLSMIISVALCFCAFAFLGSVPALGQASAAKAYALSDEAAVRGGESTNQYIEHKNYYDHKVEDKYVNPLGLPDTISSYTGGCAVTAAGNAVEYYDRTLDEDLIPNHTTKLIFGKEFYGSQDEAVQTMFAELYGLMKTNDQGTTVKDFKSGYSEYVSNHGRTLALTKAMSGGNIDVAACKAALRQGKLFTVFVDSFAITDTVRIKDGYDSIDHCLFTGAHVMTVYGFYDVDYYDADNTLTKSATYLYVTSGLSAPANGLLNIYDYVQMDDAYITEIY